MKKRGEHQINYRALAAFRYEIRRYLNFSERAGRRAGIEPHQHQALLGIKGLPRGMKATIGNLAERLQIRHHSAVELVNRIESHRLVRRFRSPTDRREVLLQLTEKGQKMIQSLSVTHRAELRSIGPRLVEALESAIPDGHGAKAARPSTPPGKNGRIKRHPRKSDLR